MNNHVTPITVVPGMTHRLEGAWVAWLKAWRSYLRAAGAPPTTINLRLNHIERAGRELGGHPRHVTTEQLLEWLASKDWQPNTRRSWRASLRSFYRWAVTSGRMKASPADALPPVKVPRSKPKPTPEPAYRGALHVQDRRVRLGVRMAGACGLRRGELAKVHTRDIVPDLVGHSLRVIGKGGHERVVPLPDDLARDLLALPDGWVFPSSRGTSHITPYWLSKLITRALRDAAETQAAKGLSTHGLRHRCGTVAYRATKDLRAVQELLGHARPETTAMYTEVEDDAIRAAMAAAAA